MVESYGSCGCRESPEEPVPSPPPFFFLRARIITKTALAIRTQPINPPKPAAMAAVLIPPTPPAGGGDSEADCAGAEDVIDNDEDDDIALLVVVVLYHGVSSMV